MRFKKPKNLGFREKEIVKKIINTGVLSNFVADPKKALTGGKYVEKFERKIEKYFKVKHAITVNSWTSGLVTMIGAAGIKQGDEVILSPWTMSACFSCIIAWGGVPIFADIDPKTFCIDPVEVRKRITKKTKAILAIDIFGQSSDIKELNKIAKKNNLLLISDSAQSIGSKYFNKYTGTVSDMGGFSFNFHKHIHTGEGGVIVTNNKLFAKKSRFIRNHAEITNNFKKKDDLLNMIGFNFRMNEIEAGIGIVQLDKLKKIIEKKQKLANLLRKKLVGLKGLSMPYVRPGCTHSYYVFAMKLSGKAKRKRSKIVQLLKKYNIPIKEKYVNLLNLPIIKSKIIFKLPQFKNNILQIKRFYKKDNFKIINSLNESEYLSLNLCVYDYSFKDITKISNKIIKTWKFLSLNN